MKLRFLRWALEYANGKVVCGEWGKSRFEGECAQLSKTGLLYAVIQEKCGCIIKEVYRAPADSFCMFSWGARAILAGNQQLNVMNTELILHTIDCNYVASVHGNDSIEAVNNANNNTLHYARGTFGGE